MPYMILNVETNQPVSDVVYDTAHEALLARGLYSFRTRIMGVATSDNAWMERERSRLADGTYTPVPDWFQQYCKPEHYVHVAQNKDITSGMIAFTENAERGQQDIQLRLSVSRYLSRFHADEMSSQTISRIYQRFMGSSSDYTLTIEQTKEAFIYAYDRQGVTSESSSFISCMEKDFSYLPEHPAAVYYTGSKSDSLAIAYIKNPDTACRTAERVLARAVVWPENKSFVRVYGRDETMRTALITMLEEAGFERTDDFSGARLARIRYDNGKFVMPYIDGDAQGIDEYDDHFEITHHGQFHANETQGYISVSRFSCEQCGDGIDDEDDIRHVGGDHWCEHCTDLHAIFCQYYEEYFPDTDGGNTVITLNWRGREEVQIWSQRAIDNAAFYCEHTERYYSDNDFNTIEVIVNKRGHIETWCETACQDDFFICPDCNKAYHTDFQSNTTNDDGEWVCLECAEKRKAEAEAEADDNIDSDTFKLPPVTPTIHDERQYTLAVAAE
jgi:hypothetical protein